MDDGATDVNSQTTRVSQSNADYNTPSAIEMRLRTQEYLETLEASLSGKHFKEQWDGENLIREEISSGTPLLNKAGTDTVMSLIRAMITPHLAQGNIDAHFHGVLMEKFNSTVVDLVHKNRWRWSITLENLQLLPTLIVNSVGMFLTRSIDNLEREAMRVTLTQNEGSNVSRSTPSRGWGPFKGRN